MGLENYSKHQQGIIKRYYQNFDGIQVQKLAELASDLYLAEGKKLERLWKQAGEVMTRLEVPADRVGHLLTRKDPALVAQLLKELESQGGK